MVDYIEETDYSFVEVNGTTGFKLLQGEFEGVVYTLSNIHFSDVDATEEDLPAVLSFNFDVVDYAGHTEEEFYTIEFKDIIGDILMSIFNRSAVENTIESKSINIEESQL
jgi:hypothetical protein